MWDPKTWLLTCSLSSLWAVWWLWRRCISDSSLKTAVSGDANGPCTRLLQVLPEITNSVTQLTQTLPSHAVNSAAGTLLAHPPLSDCWTSLPSPSPSPPPSSPRRLTFLSLLTSLTNAACWALLGLPATHCETAKFCSKHWLSGQWQIPENPRHLPVPGQMRCFTRRSEPRALCAACCPGLRTQSSSGGLFVCLFV